MSHQLLKCDSLFPVLSELRDVKRDRVGEAHLAPLDQYHYRGRGSDHFRQRREIKDRIHGQRLALGRDGAVAESLAVNDAPLPPDQHSRARRLFSFDGCEHSFIYLREPLAGHSDRFSRCQSEPV
jgi:hypothetical protein